MNEPTAPTEKDWQLECAKALNALAAEREDRISWQELYEKTNDQLAAERLKVAALVECLKEFENEYPHVTRVLAKVDVPDLNKN